MQADRIASTLTLLIRNCLPTIVYDSFPLRHILRMVSSETFSVRDTCVTESSETGVVFEASIPKRTLAKNRPHAKAKVLRFTY